MGQQLRQRPVAPEGAFLGPMLRPVLGPMLEDGARIVLLLCLSVAALFFFIYQIMAVFHPYPLDYGEAPLVDQAMRLAAGQNIYRPDISSPPYTISNYPPLYVLVLTPFIKLFGPNFWAGRSISLLCSLASGTFLALIIYNHTQDRMAAVTTGLLFLAMPYVVHWSPLLRIDMLALACSTGGLYLLACWPATRRSTIALALCLVAAIYARQSYALAAPLAAFVWLWTHDRRRAFGLAVLVGGLGLTLLLALSALTRGGLVYNIVTANVNEFDTERLGWNLRRLRDAAHILLALGGVFLILAPGRVRAWALLVPYLIGAALSSLTIGKIGSNVNYFLELCAALSLVAGALVAWSHQRRWLRVVLMVLLALQTGRLMQTTLKEFVGPLKARRHYVKQLRELEEIVAAADGPVLADEYMGMITLQRRPLYLQPFEVTQLAWAGLWDQTPLLESIHNKEFSLILIHYFPNFSVYKERWTQEMLSAINRAYFPDESLADTRVYRPIGGRAPEQACPGAPWRLPAGSVLGVGWRGDSLNFSSRDPAKAVPVYAVADGLLTRPLDWVDAVAIRHADPLRPGEQVWSVYADMADASGAESYIGADFPPGSADVPVRAGQLLGYQGVWSGRPFWPLYVHLRFAVVPAAPDGTFLDEAALENLLNPAPYLGIRDNAGAGRDGSKPLRCAETGR